MSGFGILILVILFLWIVWPYIARWLKRKAMERAEDYMRASMGLPPRNKKTRKDNSKQQTGYQEYSQQEKFRNSRRYSNTNEPLIPKEYAEDVEFVETRDYSQTDSQKQDKKERINYHESQVSDVEFVEVKKSGSK